MIIGSLARQNWHRELRHRGLEGAAAFDHVMDKTAALGREFGFSPMGIDFGVRSMPGTDRSYLDELRSRLAEAGLLAMVGFGVLAVSNDEEVRSASVEEAKRNLEVVAALGVRTSNFSCLLNGRMTRRGHVRVATEMLREVGRHARSLGIRICQENFNTFNSGELIQICAGSGLDNVGIQS
ncbi:MAG: TIM barrel protein, partial [Candidatus Dormibacteraeota bacterium]|nr:TIM barrel protein [Candidatus Dormibacteraeota bacterium]